MKVQIVKRTQPNGRVSYSIQQKHFLFKWTWVDAWVNSCVEGTTSSFDTLKEAEDHLWLFDGSRTIEEVVKTKTNPLTPTPKSNTTNK